MTPANERKAKLVPLTRGHFALVDEEDFEEVSRFKWRALEKLRADGTLRTVYAVRSGARRETVYLHRQLLGVADGVRVDHINGNGLDCQRNNLREATPAQNNMNKRMQVNNTSGFKGVSKLATCFQAQIQVDGRLRYLGRFKTAEDAARAYAEAAMAMYGDFANVAGR